MSEIASEVATVGSNTSNSGALEVAANSEEVTSGEVDTEPVYVSFKLGPHTYSCLASTILKHEETVLAKSLTDTRCSISEVIEIERDGTHFPAILDYMRDDELDMNWLSEHQVDALREEANFYGLTGLMKLCDNHFYKKIPQRARLQFLLDPKLLGSLFHSRKEALVFLNYDYLRKRTELDSTVEKIVQVCSERRCLVYYVYNNDFNLLASLKLFGMTNYALKFEKPYQDADAELRLFKFMVEVLRLL